MPKLKRQLDYLLFDNKTPFKGQADFGVKTYLSEQKELKSLFYNYCKATFNTFPFSNFSYGLGGFNATSHGYVLCITLGGIKDIHGRSALAIVGLWFHEEKQVVEFLKTYDPILTSKQVFTQKKMPVKLMPVPKNNNNECHSIFRSYDKLKKQNLVFIQKFDSTVSYKFAINILIEHFKVYSALPSILGITSAFDKNKFSQYDIVFCHTDNHNTELALTKYISKPNIFCQHKIIKTTQSYKKIKPSITSYFNCKLLLGFSVILLLLFAMLISLNKKPINVKSNIKHEKLRVKTPIFHKPPKKNNENVEYLKTVEEILTHINNIAPKALKQTLSYEIVAKIEVASQFKTKRAEIIKIFTEDMPRLRQEILDLELGYYFKEDTKYEVPIDSRIKEIKNIINNFKMPQQSSCPILKKAFGFEFYPDNSILAQWCYNIEIFYNLHLKTE